MLRFRIWSAGALAACLSAAAFADPVISGYPSDMSDRERIELLAQWGYFQEALQEIDSLDSQKYAPMREIWRRVGGQTRRTLRRAPPGSKAYQAVPQEIQLMVESLQKWQLYLGISSKEAARHIGEWKAGIIRRWREFEKLRWRYDLPKRSHAADVVTQTVDLGKDGREETAVVFWVQPENKIARGGAALAGEQFVKVLRVGATVPVSLGEFSLGEPRTPQMSVLDIGERRMLVVETFAPEHAPMRGGASAEDEKARKKSAAKHAASEGRKESVLSAFILDGDQLMPASLEGDGASRPLLKFKRSYGASASDVEFQDDGKWLVMTFQQEALRDVFQQGVGAVRTHSRREFGWNGRQYNMRSARDTVQFSGSVFRGSRYSQGLPQGLVFEFVPIESGWDMVVRSTATRAAAAVPASTGTVAVLSASTQTAAPNLLTGPHTIDARQLKGAAGAAERTKTISFEGGKLEVRVVNLHFGMIEEAPYAGTAQPKPEAPLERIDFTAKIDLTRGTSPSP